ncbi:hypothetical protein F2Q69_00061510 [Brassica cretica]|uniref:Uncharacterized protein n=1 Tax=Brassica cretica TaxID=69181 RepID=A0A8S9RGJ6_BRACR|nr:hypothetical protein F2Q69_00061510 [Brassica cretica]
MVKIKRSGIGEPGTGEPSNCRSIRLGTGASASNVTHDACDSLSGCVSTNTVAEMDHRPWLSDSYLPNPGTLQNMRRDKNIDAEKPDYNCEDRLEEFENCEMHFVCKSAGKYSGCGRELVIKCYTDMGCCFSAHLNIRKMVYPWAAPPTRRLAAPLTSSKRGRM